MLNDYFLSIYKNKSEFKLSIQSAKLKLGHFADVNNYLKRLSIEQNNEISLSYFLKNYSSAQKERVEIIFAGLYPEIKNMDTVMTLSRSGTVLIKVIVCESRPKYEGRLMAESLAKAGIQVELITDAMMSLLYDRVDAAIIGADSILKNGNIVNKAGSKSLALLCKEYKKPFYVVTARSKFSTTKEFKPKKENPKEVFNKKFSNLSVANIYFEEIDKKFITKIYTD
ncbi:MAG: hypothetical protein HUU44_11600 [Ignavibacteriaceae bacterium]|nr:hypothetical protein [Ignavibacteriaceae bacterium]